MTSLERDNTSLRQALHLIKIHISESGEQSRDLHNAVQLIVNVARKHGMLLPGSTEKFYKEGV